MISLMRIHTDKEMTAAEHRRLNIEESEIESSQIKKRNKELLRCYNEKINDMGGHGCNEMKGYSTIELRCTSHYINVSVKKLYPVSFELP